MNATPWLSLVTFLPLVGALFIMTMRGEDEQTATGRPRWPRSARC